MKCTALGMALGLAVAAALLWALQTLTAPAECEPVVNLGAWARTR